jgi:tRNA(Arg) A34 adenosine deaminase TadA
MDRDTKYIQIAVEMAKGVPRFGEHRMAALLVLKNEIISTGFNTSKKHPVALKYARSKAAIYPHAEILSIHNASKKLDIEDFRKTVLYVARVKRTEPRSPFVWGMAMPCEGCRRAIIQFGIKKVVYTTDNGQVDTWNRGDNW